MSTPVFFPVLQSPLIPETVLATLDSWLLKKGLAGGWLSQLRQTFSQNLRSSSPFWPSLNERSVGETARAMPLGVPDAGGPAWLLLLLPEVADCAGVRGSACPAAGDDFLRVVSSLGPKEWKEPRFHVCLLPAGQCAGPFSV